MPANPPPAPPSLTGFGYVRPLGSGGFADVFQYEQDMPRRVVAVKVLRAPMASGRERSDFEAEADAMARLSSHPSIVSIFSAGVSADGRPYLAMEYCPDSMRARTRGTPAPLHVVLDAGVRLASALETAHRSGILHRDIKPSNVLITSTGRPALTDFGISTLQDRTGSQLKQQALSIPWSAPEVVRGESNGTVASEVWSLGATLYTFASGISPFEHRDRAQNTHSKMTARIARARYTPVAGARGYEPFDEVLRRSMQLGPELRFSSMREFGEALRGLQRAYGFDPTPFDVVDAEWVAAPADPRSPRGQAITAVRNSSRAQRRAELHENSDGVVQTTARLSPWRAAMIGSGVTVLVIGVALAAAVAFGWLR